MNESPGKDRPEPGEGLGQTINAKETRKLNARNNPSQGAWFGLGMFGLVGWSVAIPTVLCIALGIWIDRQWPSRISWTLTLMAFGLVMGCLTAWSWIKKESKHE